ncbi:GGDEF domain-containing protein [Enterobacter huaxiensis]|uniref:GGDEF domain-containing protein n=1 Tax=Enterobacter huaxiensis TaxID=2494702 RepID=UPI00295414C8|nr:GGDEF domain-containing protein [Enterobacter huaxiensis]
MLIHRRDGKRFGLIMVDVDHFKLYNDHYGHQRGDECLTVIARTLEIATRDNAGVVGRIGGEEFVILLPDADISAVQRLANTIASALANQALPHAVSPVSPYVTVSQGLTIWEAHQTAESVIARADKALYMAKQQGRNRWTVAE